MTEINPTIHQPTRLRIMAALASMEPGTRVDFSYLLELLSLTDGNLSVHLQKLEAEGWLATKKEFVGRRPKTWVSITAAGRRAFGDYIAAMEEILKTRLE